MKAIWKFHIRVTDNQEIEMPVNAKILCVQMQGGEPFIWAEVDTDAPILKRKIKVFGTGHPMPDEQMEYIGTFQMINGRVVLHAYADHL